MNNESFNMSSTEMEDHNSSNIDKMKPTTITSKTCFFFRRSKQNYNFTESLIFKCKVLFCN